MRQPMHRRSFLMTAAALAALHRAGPAAAAEASFNGPLRIVVPAAAGGFTDISSRMVADGLARRIDQPVLVDDKPGASGMIGSEIVAHGPPDGSMVVMGNIQTHAANVGMFKERLRYDVLRDFAPVTRVAMGYNVLVVLPSSPVHRIDDLMALSKQQTLTYGSGGSGSSAHLATEMLRQRAGIENMLHVPFRANAPALQALLSGQISMLFDTTPSATAQVRAGTLRAIAVTSSARLPSLPGVPTVAESLPGFEVAVWGGLYAPAGTPPKWVDALDAQVQALLKDPAMVQRFDQLGFAADTLGPADFAAFTKAEIAKWSEVIKVAKITAD